MFNVYIFGYYRDSIGYLFIFVMEIKYMLKSVCVFVVECRLVLDDINVFVIIVCVKVLYVLFSCFVNEIIFGF